jgi:ubiquinone biosynthesis monooxygenase Coq7
MILNRPLLRVTEGLVLLPSKNEKVTIERILRVNHAGETGAIRIYRAQIAVARRRFPHIVPALDEMKRDEIEHCRLFFDAMQPRSTRPCRVISLWTLGGYVLGASTAILGEKAVWICTEAVEDTVHRHLGHQLSFLRDRDPQLHGIIESIQEQELAHLLEARDHQVTGPIRSVGFPVIAALTSLMIWLSTWGNASWMTAEMSASQ